MPFIIGPFNQTHTRTASKIIKRIHNPENPYVSNMMCWFWPVKFFWYCPSAEIYNVKFFFSAPRCGHCSTTSISPSHFILKLARFRGRGQGASSLLVHSVWTRSAIHCSSRKEYWCVAFFHQRVFNYFEISTVGYPRYWYLPIKSNFSWSMASMSVKFIVHPTTETGATSTGKNLRPHNE